MKRTNIHLTIPQLEQLKLLVEKTGLCVAELIRRAVDEYIRKEKNK
jgi:predicted DNA-binding protein